MPILPKGRSKGTGLLLESQTFIRVPQTGAAIKTNGTQHGCHINRRDAAQRPILPKGQGTKALFYRRDADTQPPNTHVRAVSSKYRKGRGCSSNPRPSLGSRGPEQQLKPEGRGTDAYSTEGTRHGGLYYRRDADTQPPNTHMQAVPSKYRKGRGCSSNPRPSLGSR
jgi:hypothetical protein